MATADHPMPPRPARQHALRLALIAIVLALIAACGEVARLPPLADVGPRPQLPEPTRTLIPTVHVAPAVGWPPGAAPVAANGLQVSAFARNLAHPRWIHVLPNGDVLVAETNAPPRPEEGKGFKGWVMGKLMKRAGAAVPSANRITLLRDADGDGQAELRTVFLEGLNSPFGMALVGNRFFVANTDGVVEFPYLPGATRITAPGRPVASLPAGPRNHHWTKNIIASPDGTRLYATVGSNSNVAEHGMAAEDGRAAIWEIDLRPGGALRVYATGLRNPNGMAWVGNQLWTVVNERDELGSDLVPDYLTSVRGGAFYGWPYVWYGSHVDDRVRPPAGTTPPSALVPDYALGAHVAPLGLAAGQHGLLASAFDGRGDGMFVGLHGSWNRRPRAGYKVVYVPFADGRPSAMPVDVLTGFVDAEGRAQGRPVGVAIDARGALLVADDVGNTIWRVSRR